MRQMLAGGVLADGVRDKMTTPHDVELMEALVDDTVAERYGWTPEQIDTVPAKRLDNMLLIARLKEEAKELRRGREHAGTGHG